MRPAHQPFLAARTALVLLLGGILAANAPFQSVVTFNLDGIRPDIKTISFTSSNSNYNGMVAVAKYQSRKGYFLQASYTLSKSLDYNSAYLLKVPMLGK